MDKYSKGLVKNLEGGNRLSRKTDEKAGNGSTLEVADIVPEDARGVVRVKNSEAQKLALHLPPRPVSLEALNSRDESYLPDISSGHVHHQLHLASLFVTARPTPAFLELPAQTRSILLYYYHNRK